MIRWARRSDDRVRPAADTLEDWRAAWLRMWRSAEPGREVLAVAVPALEELEEHFARLSHGRDRLPPGTRLVVTCEHRVGQEPASGDGWELAGWSPELPHLCDPLPGDPRATEAWRDRERILIDPLGRTVVGAVLAKKLRLEEMETTTFLPRTGRGLAREYFPLPEDGHLPAPERLREGRPCKAGDLAEAFGVSLTDAMPLIEELLFAGAITIVGGKS